MTAHLQRRLPMSELAQSVQVSTAHLRRLFKAETGSSPVQYLRQMRIQRAKELLESSSLSVKEVAAKVGLSDVSHFVRNFERAAGLPPTRHRTRHHREAGTAE
jgi:transcriptional regulator GlxA family with amidase domain